MKDNARHFACTSCGRCCTHGPEMEISEATTLADRFISRLVFKLQSLPANSHSVDAVDWWKTQGSSLPIRKSLDEAMRHISLFSIGDSANSEGRRRYLTISARSLHLNRGGCPALKVDRCSIYSSRPLTCKSVPFHYSMPSSTLVRHFDRFVKTEGYRCDTTEAAPRILSAHGLDDAAFNRVRSDSVALTHQEKEWKEGILAAMDPDEAEKNGLPSYQEVALNSPVGATSVSMAAAWKVALRLGILTSSQFTEICRHQVRLIRSEVALAKSAPNEDDQRHIGTLQSMLLDYSRLCGADGWRLKVGEAFVRFRNRLVTSQK